MDMIADFCTIGMCDRSRDIPTKAPRHHMPVWAKKRPVKRPAY